MTAGRHDAWLELCRNAVEAQKRIFSEHTGIEGRTVYEGVGEGGDRALVIDRLCEDAVFELLEKHHRGGSEFVAVSEERGEVSFGTPGEDGARVVIDPIDGSMNARRTIPSHCLSIAVSNGPTMAGVEFGYVYDFGAGEEFTASAGDGARLGEQRLQAPQGQGLEVVGLEAAKPERTIAATEKLVGEVYRLRVIGSIAISLCYVGAGRLDGMLSLRDSRSVDAAAAQLIAREAGAAVAFGDAPLEQTPLHLDARYPVAAARDKDDLPVLVEAQAAVPA